MKNVFLLLHEIKTFIKASCRNTMETGEKALPVATFYI